MAIDMAEPTPSSRRRSAWWEKLIKVVGRARSRGQQLWDALGRTVKFLVLLLLILTALASTTILDRASQVLLLKVFVVAFLSLLPGWLYLQFIKVKGIGLYDEYVLNLYRLHIDDIVNLPKPPPGSRYWQQWFKAIQDADVDPARNIYLKKFEAALPPRPGRLRFRPVGDDAEVLAVVRGTLEGTLDVHARRDVARDGVDAAARAIVEELPGPRSLVRLAYDPAGSCVGMTVPGLRPWGADISYVGVLPERRGKGDADELLLEAGHLLVEGGATEIVAATDVGNAPMAAAFARCGYVVVDRLMVHV
jgi:ribosomal protein S18 acetylase RimI-like enzyme